MLIYVKYEGFPGGSDGKASASNAGDLGSPWVGKILWRRQWQPTPVLLPGKSHGPRSLVAYSPWGHKESDMTERLRFTSLSKAALCLSKTSCFIQRCSVRKVLSQNPWYEIKNKPKSSIVIHFINSNY